MKKIKVILVILAVILLVCAVEIGKTKLKTKIKENSYNKTKHEIYEQEKEEMIKPRGMFLLNEKYEGDNDLDDFYREIKNHSEYDIEKYQLKSSGEEIHAIIDTDSFNDNGTFLSFNMNYVYDADDMTTFYEVRLLNALSNKQFVSFIEKTE